MVEKRDRLVIVLVQGDETIFYDRINLNRWSIDTCGINIHLSANCSNVLCKVPIAGVAPNTSYSICISLTIEGHSISIIVCGLVKIVCGLVQ